MDQHDSAGDNAPGRAARRLEGLRADLARVGPPDVHLVRATLDEPAPPAPLAPGVDLRVALLSALASRSILDAYGRASPAELDDLHARLRANAPAVRRLTRRSLAAFLVWTEAALRPYLDDAREAGR